jgi:hypothetical protein
MITLLEKKPLTFEKLKLREEKRYLKYVLLIDRTVKIIRVSIKIKTYTIWAFTESQFEGVIPIVTVYVQYII